MATALSVDQPRTGSRPDPGDRAPAAAPGSGLARPRRDGRRRPGRRRPRVRGVARARWRSPRRWSPHRRSGPARPCAAGDFRTERVTHGRRTPRHGRARRRRVGRRRSRRRRRRSSPVSSSSRRRLRPRAARHGLRAMSIPIDPSRAVGGRLRRRRPRRRAVRRGARGLDHRRRRRGRGGRRAGPRWHRGEREPLHGHDRGVGPAVAARRGRRRRRRGVACPARPGAGRRGNRPAGPRPRRRRRSPPIRRLDDAMEPTGRARLLARAVGRGAASPPRPPRWRTRSSDRRRSGGRARRGVRRPGRERSVARAHAGLRLRHPRAGSAASWGCSIPTSRPARTISSRSASTRPSPPTPPWPSSSPRCARLDAGAPPRRTTARRVGDSTPSVISGTGLARRRVGAPGRRHHRGRGRRCRRARSSARPGRAGRRGTTPPRRSRAGSVWGSSPTCAARSRRAHTAWARSTTRSSRCSAPRSAGVVAGFPSPVAAAQVTTREVLDVVRRAACEPRVRRGRRRRRVGRWAPRCSTGAPRSVAVVAANPVGVVRALDWLATVHRRHPGDAAAPRGEPRAEQPGTGGRRSAARSCGPSLPTSITWIPADRSARGGGVERRGRVRGAVPPRRRAAGATRSPRCRRAVAAGGHRDHRRVRRDPARRPHRGSSGAVSAPTPTSTRSASEVDRGGRRLPADRAARRGDPARRSRRRWASACCARSPTSAR